jgi:hypothetical protein
MKLTGVTLAGPAAAWAAAGFAVAGDTVTVGHVALRLTGAAGAGEVAGGAIAAWAFDHVASPGGDLDGLPTGSAPAPAPGAAHPNGATRIDHIVVLTPDVDRTTAVFEGAGLDLRRIRPTRSRHDGSPQLQAFFRAGEVIVELVGPAGPTGEGGGSGSGDGGAARFFGLAFASGDLDATAALLGDHLSPARRAVQPGRRIATLRRDLGLSVPVAFLSDPERTPPTGSEA